MKKRFGNTKAFFCLSPIGKKPALISLMPSIANLAK
jgi:hypothetical protein